MSSIQQPLDRNDMQERSGGEKQKFQENFNENLQKSNDQQFSRSNDPMLQKGFQTTSEQSQSNEEKFDAKKVDVKELTRNIERFPDERDNNLTRFQGSQDEETQKRLELGASQQKELSGNLPIKANEGMNMDQASEQLRSQDKNVEARSRSDPNFIQQNLSGSQQQDQTFIPGVGENLVNQDVSKGIAQAAGSAQCKDIAGAFSGQDRSSGSGSSSQQMNAINESDMRPMGFSDKDERGAQQRMMGMDPRNPNKDQK